MAATPPYDFMTKEELEKEEYWWTYQGWMLMAGLICGVVANLFFRSQRNNLNYNSEASNTSAMGNRASSSGSKLAQQFAQFSTNNKMVLIVRSDLGMGRGKAAAQCAHAAVSCYKKASKDAPNLVQQWEIFGQTKVALKVEGQEAILELRKKAIEAGLVACLVEDAGRTQVDPGSITVLGIGPGPQEVVDKVSGHLKLY